jgi:hypothetical protein
LECVVASKIKFKDIRVVSIIEKIIPAFPIQEFRYMMGMPIAVKPLFIKISKIYMKR